jgi:phosphoenolpyruvate-protein kinase (PTS system EI component)
MHRVLLEDPTLVDAARDQISLGKSAGFAWRATIRAQIDTLSRLDDALLAERAADLRDIEKRVLRALATRAARRDARAARRGRARRRGVHAVGPRRRSIANA